MGCATKREGRSRADTAAAPGLAGNPGERSGQADDRLCTGLIDRLEARSEEHTSELQSLMRISYAVFCLKKKKNKTQNKKSKYQKQQRLPTQTQIISNKTIHFRSSRRDRDTAARI